MKAMQAKMDANRVRLEAIQDKMETNQARTETNQKEMITKLDAHQERMKARVNAW
jgi:hypothetical protein